MNRGLYLASSGMKTRQQNLKLISNNLANSNTAGYKTDDGVQRSFSDVLISKIEKGKKPRQLGGLGTGVGLEDNYTDFNQGSLRNTGNSLDLAIEGDGFFAVQTPEGERYTRNGNFTLNNQGQIVTQQGYQLMGERGPLQTIDGRQIAVDKNGQLFLGDIPGDSVKVVTFEEKNQLTKIGDNLYQTPEGVEEVTPDNYQIRQGYLEESNVNIVQEMAKMIEGNRLYQANQQVISNINNTLNKSVNVVGRLG